jgi:hypothetical protein
LRVEQKAPVDFPRSVEIEGEQIPVIIDRSWKVPRPQEGMPALKKSAYL